MERSILLSTTLFHGKVMKEPEHERINSGALVVRARMGKEGVNH